MRNLFLAVVSVCLGCTALLCLAEFNLNYFFDSIKNIQPLSWRSLSTVFFCGFLIGWERMLKKKQLGIRTSVFIILGTYVFTALSIHVAKIHFNSNVDPTRIIGQIVSGIGFLGAGVMFTKGDRVSGLTSAASIWLLAALGVCVGLGYLTTAVILATLGVTLLMTISEVDDRIVKISKKVFARKTVNNKQVIKNNDKL